MSLANIQHKYEQSLQLNTLQNWLINNQNKLILNGLSGSSLSFVLAEIFKKSTRSMLLVLEEKEEAAYIFNDLEALIPDKSLMFYPASYKRPYQIEEVDNANILLRSEVLNKINSSKKPLFTVTYPDALFEKVVTKSTLKKNTLTIHVGDSISLDFVNEVLFEYQFQRVDFVSSPGEFSVRGGIVDVFSFSNDKPYRIEFFGDEVESIRTFDIESQLSLQKLNKIQLLPNIENKAMLENRESFLSYIPKNTIVIHKNKELIFNILDKLFEKSEKAFQNSAALLQSTAPINLFTNGSELSQLLNTFKTIQLGTFDADDLNQESIVFNTKPQPSFNKHFELLFDNLQQNTADGFTNYLCCTNDKQAQRFHDIFEDIDRKISYKTLILPLYQGFIDIDNQIVCYTDHQIFERYHKFRLKEGFVKNQSISIKELSNLEIGDYVTHIDHGIGKFGGLQKIEIEGKQQETIKLIYGDRDLLYISIHSLHKISKYNSRDGKEPKLYKLGSGAWQKVKQKTKQRVKEIAFDLIQLYAKRKLQKGFAFGPDSYMQHELESSFMYEDTPDQYQATQTVKADMENDAPMDRLVCGDVGFGKTEVAIRAAFKAVDNGKQVAVLVPTTILAFQHYQTFKDRLSEFPLRVDYLNRFRSAKEKTEIYKSIADGKIDIIIGTHQLTNKELHFKDLGLLIIDEEQKFGVAVKDKLKTIKENVDTLTLTATPIPRTLQFSLMAARD
ncbi:MAG TPA: DEAD/DEAH box helicase, partial [Flavobacteriaceae bacterium]|nr:DEAD/DEAH box helicase [Flavobacteriaceae bacterium]